MFYGKDSIEETFNLLLHKLEVADVFLFEPMPSYKLNERWTDEFRIRDGHTKLADGTWVTIHKSTTWLEKMKQDTIEVYDNYQDALRKNRLLIQKNREMEYALRVSAKALKNSLELTKEMIDD